MVYEISISTNFWQFSFILYLEIVNLLVYPGETNYSFCKSVLKKIAHSGLKLQGISDKSVNFILTRYDLIAKLLRIIKIN